MTPKNHEAFEAKLLSETERLLEKEFQNTKEFSGEWFHYTKPENVNPIISNQSFHASFIRATSDPLEFSLPFVICRDWVCLSKEFLSASNATNFPVRFFQHFNEQALSPDLRPYFISLCHDKNSEHLKTLYGKGIIKFEKANNTNGFKQYGSLIKCKYVDDPKKNIFDLMNRWRDEVFNPALVEFKIYEPEKDFKPWLYILMKLCYEISLGFKQEAFASEQEMRLVLFPNPKVEETNWHGKREFKTQSEKFKIYREYIPVNLEQIGIRVSVSV